MIRQIQYNKDPLKAMLSQQKHNIAMLTSAEYDRLAKLETVLEPCRYITELLGGEKYVSCSVVLPALHHLLRPMEVSDVDPAYISRFKAAFTKDLNRRKENSNLWWLKVATALDPRFKNLRCFPRAEREELSEMLKDREPAPQTSGEKVESEPPKKKMALLLMGSESLSDEEVLATDKSLERYKAESCVSIETCPLQWWSSQAGTYGKLAHIAKRYLATPASTVPCERLFSLAGHIVQKKRSALSSENVNKLVCL
ncbi:zinc finger BED domain-containing protein 4-like [Ictalurus furcatus]|uniref:zinc finger BED domain-containing protein 4-like n=1 Tax=Ictalurus furcatus TaxID=66913 RepID=UPI00234FF689|nr:zinc finger BED domain-containing protein 4-like [Ictalurus furcatus]XP_053510052.1 zinc finger BED domain-containing protein 4-like [Ictalurus furcatus]XP_053510053.1 zinc finger BED domain-containing protein 4-like [Ictalurus furcatus]XP_053510054.1 zinc finger BED domain-containing protein 4-like [Ictalurus furcatus]XP_053510055.1 zinc finger BED domain-containing protein 4-like [Ictalurus furcatus]